MPTDRPGQIGQLLAQCRCILLRAVLLVVLSPKWLDNPRRGCLPGLRGREQHSRRDRGGPPAAQMLRTQPVPAEGALFRALLGLVRVMRQEAMRRVQADRPARTML